MTGHILTVREPAGPPIDLTGVLPGRLAGDGAGVTVICGRERHPLDALFDIRDGGPSGSLILRPEGAVLDAVGAGMAEGEILVEGDCGDQAGRAMRGGTLIVEGRCGAHAAAAMQGGRLMVAGDAGDFLGAPLPGGTKGMGGGTVTVGGSAGDRVGERMRRGLVTIQGNVGALCCARMIAGTVVVGGGCGPEPAAAMRRGTFLLCRAPDPPPTGFVDGGENDWLFLELLRRELRVHGSWPAGFPVAGTRARRLIGDRSAGGRGELLILSEA
ncbi:formylmethanofuran dehydrogenase subunit C [Azospirillum sp. RWY-5-1]|uniref:Formylmethanofuran dehydrogenase subunit C n=1 Tax=Azospirillum oleiclasticum TaxID=2735135 RepID=A0ABX2TJ19_9PROT|nr:formylmethanofuran dehydrogenase subunit C [Azospirillum oleiclasticum]NYZ14480.1 formylmethanofuran dehydrogenase subunit C [Azospirillum oleiclasticum]NYZ23168.1 formylmethanofuran dehydrogenase subunit C [Azospirillum oleiclasticum]